MFALLYFTLDFHIHIQYLQKQVIEIKKLVTLNRQTVDSNRNLFIKCIMLCLN